METFETLEEILARRAIETLGEIRAKYNFWNEKERPYYEALSEAIRVLKAQNDNVHYAKIVRCGECKHTKDDGLGAIYCMKWDRWEMPENFFCAYGEREVQE